MNLITKIITLGYAPKEANGLILTGKVFVNQRKIEQINFQVSEKDQIEVKKTFPWVSRAALKLAEATEKFAIDFLNKTVLDIGSSTGGFTDFVLQKGASKIYATDVGKNQLAYKLRINEKIIVYEKTNVKSLEKEHFDTKIDIILADVSFISLLHVVKFLATKLDYQTEIYLLLKPQFEAHRNEVSVGGFVEEKYHPEIIQRFASKIKQYKLKIADFFPCQTKGAKKHNQEYFLKLIWGD